MPCKQPTLRLDEDRCQANIRRYVDRAGSLTVRPHFKTHQSIAVGKWFFQQGVDKITVSSVGMARYFADHGWTDILIAFPVNILELDEINDLAVGCKLTLLVENTDSALHLKMHLKSNVHIVIEIDTGSGRSGIDPKDNSRLHRMIEIIESSTKMTWEGFYSHAGHTYSARSKEDIQAIAKKALNELSRVKKYNKSIYWGDTPSCSVLDDFNGIDVLTAGNLVFYDVMQSQAGSCELNDVAVAMECPVVSQKSSTELVVYGGAIHFSKEQLSWEGEPCFGLVVARNQNTWTDKVIGTLYKISQEHGKVRLLEEEQNIKIGDSIYILPVHSCLTAQCVGTYLTTTDEPIDHYAQKKHTV